MNQRRWIEYRSDRFKGLSSDASPGEPLSDSLLIMLHGVGSNEEALLQDGAAIFPGGKILSLRGPLRLGRIAFAYFRIEFTENGPVHNWDEASASLKLLYEEIEWVSKDQKIPLNKIFLLGFSQGAIMILGALIQGGPTLGGYIAFAGRTLPEFADFARSKASLPKDRPLFLAHGRQDATLPVSLGHATRDLITDLNGNLTYEEYDHGHGIPHSVWPKAQEWILSIHSLNEHR